VTEPLAIGWAHPDGKLPSAWFRAYKRLKRTVRRAGLHARVELVPIGEAGDAFDLLVVPPELAGAPAPASTQRVVTAPEDAQRELDAVVERLLAEGLLDYEPGPAAALAVHRGCLPVHGRGRVED
jgi:hypothetical protein